MRKSPAAIAAVLIASFNTIPLLASVPLEQIEPFEVPSGGDPSSATQYAPVDFGGASQITLAPGQQGGAWDGITFHALGGVTDTTSSHADEVGTLFYGSSTVAYPFVTDVYVTPATTFLQNIVKGQSDVSATGPIPDHFAGGAKVIENGYVGSATSPLDAQRRLDFMINRDDVTFIASTPNAGTSSTDTLAWTSYNSLAVGGGSSFDPTGSPGKMHVDLGHGGLTSFSDAIIAGYAVGLYGQAQSAGQTDALHGPVIRSLLMTGTDKTVYTRQTTNNLDVQEGAGEPDYTNSLATLRSGEKDLLNVGSGGAMAGVPSWSEKGWTQGIIPAGGRSAVLFHSDGGLTALSASLNWNVDQPLNAGDPTELDTASNPIFPNLTLEVRPITYFNGIAQLGAASSDPILHSSATNDNVQYLYVNTPLPAGDYAFVITGDSALSPAVGFSYSITEPQTMQWSPATSGSWNTGGNWPGGVPNSAGAQANFVAGSGGSNSPATITLDGNKTIGQLTFDNANAYTLSAGSGGTLTIDDTGDSAGVNPAISIVSGNHTISAPVALANGVTITTASGSSLTITGNITGAGGLKTIGTGALILAGTNNYGDTTVTTGTLTLAAGGSIASANITISNGATFNATGALSSSPAVIDNGSLHFSANPNSGILVRTLSSLTLGSTATVGITDPANHANRTVLVTSDLSLPGTINNWSGSVDLAGNDLIVHNANLAALTNQLAQAYNSPNSAYWSGPGIRSSTAAADSTFLTTLGIEQPATTTNFDTQPVTTTDVVIKYTLFGDTNLDGQITAADYNQLALGFANHLTGWSNGDFNYDGVIDASDFTLIDNAAANTQNATPLAIATSQIATTAIPEPSTLLISILLGAIAFTDRRRKVITVILSEARSAQSKDLAGMD